MINNQKEMLVSIEKINTSLKELEAPYVTSP
jgi:hypothetical protein